MDNLPQQKNTAWTQKFWRDDKGPVCKSSFVLQKIIEEKTCLQVYLKKSQQLWVRIDAKKNQCQRCRKSTFQLYLANLLFHFLWLVGWIVTLSSIAVIVGTKYRNILQTVIKSHKNVQIGNFHESGQILAFSTKVRKEENVQEYIGFHFVYYLLGSLKPMEKTLCLMAWVGF